MRRAIILHRAGHIPGRPTDCLRLDYEARFLRRRKLITTQGAEVLIDLPETVSLHHGDALEDENGGLIIIEAQPEALLKVTGNLPRLAWHIGNRHAPCQIAHDHLLLRDDPVMADMLTHLGADVTRVLAPFTPERGAYGHGRTHGHTH